VPLYMTSQGEVYFEQSGSGQPLMLLHADGASGIEYTSVIHRLAEHFQVIVVDFPGCGRSPRRAFSHDYYIENAKAALNLSKELVKDPIWIIGNGGGAIAGLWMAILAPLKTRGVIADSLVEFFDLEDVQKDLLAHEKPSQEMISFWNEMNGEDWQIVMNQLDRVTVGIAEQKRSVFNWRLEEVTCPVLVTGSRHDHLLSSLAQRSLDLAEQLPLGKLILYPEGGHPSMWSQAASFWRDALTFIDGHNQKPTQVP